METVSLLGTHIWTKHNEKRKHLPCPLEVRPTNLAELVLFNGPEFEAPLPTEGADLHAVAKAVTDRVRVLIKYGCHTT